MGVVNPLHPFSSLSFFFDNQPSGTVIKQQPAVSLCQSWWQNYHTGRLLWIFHTQTSSPCALVMAQSWKRRGGEGGGAVSLHGTHRLKWDACIHLWAYSYAEKLKLRRRSWHGSSFILFLKDTKWEDFFLSAKNFVLFHLGRKVSYLIIFIANTFWQQFYNYFFIYTKNLHWPSERCCLVLPCLFASMRVPTPSPLWWNELNDSNVWFICLINDFADDHIERVNRELQEVYYVV